MSPPFCPLHDEEDLPPPRVFHAAARHCEFESSLLATTKPIAQELDSVKCQSYPLCQRKTEDGLEKGLANLRGGKKITIKARGGRGQKTKLEMS
jgi:hypothetical protein